MFEKNKLRFNKAIIPSKVPFALIILDGWGIAPSWGGNAIKSASTPIFNELWRNYPSTSLQASGLSVGLPEGAPGNSEAGHLNIGAGKIVHQDVSIIDDQIQNGELFKNRILQESVSNAKKKGSNIHLLGLLSDVGTHSHVRHLDTLLKYYKNQNFNRVYIHLFSDGRDSDPMSGIELIGKVESMILSSGVGRIESIIGRFFAMDRDNRWGRTARAYNCLVKSEAEIIDSPKEAFSKSYSTGVFDEFIEPKIVSNKVSRFVPIKDNDTVLIFNFRFDRVKQLADCFLKDNIKEFPDRKKLSGLYVCSFASEAGENNLKTIITPEKISEPLAKVISDKGLIQFHISETEKFPHVTYFIDGGAGLPFPGETRAMVPSPNVRTYDLTPEMSAKKVCDTVLSELEKGKNDFYIINFANPDMVGHTGNLKATMQAVTFVDQCLGQIIVRIQSLSGSAIVCSDHGNAEQMVNPQTGDPDTEHNTNPVPFILVNNSLKDKVDLSTNGSLSNIAPTILDILHIDRPNDMKAKESLIIMKDS